MSSFIGPRCRGSKACMEIRGKAVRAELQYVSVNKYLAHREDNGQQGLIAGFLPVDSPFCVCLVASLADAEGDSVGCCFGQPNRTSAPRDRRSGANATPIVQLVVQSGTCSASNNRQNGDSPI